MNKWILGLSVPLYLAGLATVQAEDSKFDVAVQAVIANDNMTYGLTNTDHKFYGSMSVTPSYGIFYGTAFIENLKYTNVADPSLVNSRLKLTAGITPSIGDLSFDINVQRDMKLSDAQRYRTVPYVTATYKFNDSVSALLGAGYYAYDDVNFSPNTAELYAGLRLTATDWLSLSGDFTYDNAGGFSTAATGPGAPTKDYWEGIASATVTLPHDFSVVGTIGFEQYMSNPLLPDYMWYDLGLNYAMNSHVTLGLHYIGNSLGTGSVNCGLQSFNADCDSRVVASITLAGNLSDIKSH